MKKAPRLRRKIRLPEIGRQTPSGIFCRAEMLIPTDPLSASRGGGVHQGEKQGEHAKKYKKTQSGKQCVYDVQQGQIIPRVFSEGVSKHQKPRAPHDEAHEAKGVDKRAEDIKQKELPEGSSFLFGN